MRISRDEMLMQIAGVVAQRGTCSRAQVGAVVSRDGRIIATGYNGAPAGLPHCDHSEDQELPPMGMVFHHDNRGLFKGSEEDFITYMQPNGMFTFKVGCTIAAHAEQNAVAFAARHGLALDGGDLHVTHAPCENCARSVINAGIKRVFYLIPYRLTAGVDLLNAAGIEVVAMNDRIE